MEEIKNEEVSENIESIEVVEEVSDEDTISIEEDAELLGDEDE